MIGHLFNKSLVFFIIYNHDVALYLYNNDILVGNKLFAELSLWVQILSDVMRYNTNLLIKYIK